MTVRAWFPTLIYEATVAGGAALNRELLAESRKLREIDAEGRRWSARHYPDGYTSYHSMPQLHRTSPTFGDLEKRLARHVAKYAKALDYDLTGRSLAMTDCWVSIMPRHGAHGLHLHPISTISGSYYVRTPKGASAIKFEDPRLASQMASPPRLADARSANRAFVSYPVTAGRVILFESWLRHEVPPNRTNAERVAVSFNFNWF